MVTKSQVARTEVGSGHEVEMALGKKRLAFTLWWQDWGGIYKGCILKTELWRLVDGQLWSPEGKGGSGIIGRLV